jgi:hypothetical protein
MRDLTRQTFGGMADGSDLHTQMKLDLLRFAASPAWMRPSTSSCMATTVLLEHLAAVIRWTAGRLGDERAAAIVNLLAAG